MRKNIFSIEKLKLIIVLASLALIISAGLTSTGFAAELFVSPFVEGMTYTATSAGTYRFMITSGAYQACPPLPDNPECGQWKTEILVYKNRPIEWSGGPLAPEYPVPGNRDFTIGSATWQQTYLAAEQVGQGSYIDLALQANEYVNLIIQDAKGLFWDNAGGVYLDISPVVQEIPGQIIFFDDFEAYNLNTFPNSGGWQLLYNGTGSSLQYVDNINSVSGTQSLHLVGSTCWSSNAYHSVNIPSHLIFEANVYVDQITSCGCTSIIAHMELIDPNLTTWGTAYGMVTFDCDGNIYARQNPNNIYSNVFLSSYSARTWYNVQLDINLTDRSFDVYVNGVLRGSGFPIYAVGMPTGVTVSAGHGNNPTVWFDDVKVAVPQVVQPYTLIVSKTGTGSGMVISNPAGIDCGNSCSSAFNSTDQVILTATPDSDSTFTMWNGCDSTNGNQCTITMNTAKNVTATFTLVPTIQQYDLTITKLGTGHGKITSSPSGIDCGSVCSAKYNQGTVVTLTAVPDNGCIFTGWNGGSCAGAGTCTTTVNGDTNITAIFSLQTGTPKITVRPKSVNFKSVEVETTSGPKTITILNKGNGYLAINSVTIIGSNANEFDETNDCSSLAPGESCTIIASFAPKTFLGKKSATLIVSSNDPKKPTILVKLSGKATPKNTIEGVWDIKGKMTITVSIEGEKSQKQKNVFYDEFTFDHNGYFEMIDMDGTWSQNGINFSVTLDPESISDYFSYYLEDEIGSDVDIEETQLRFIGKKQKNGTIKGTFTLNADFYVDDYDISGTITATATYTGKQIATLSMSSMKEKKASSLPESIRNVIKKGMNSAVRSF